MKKSEIKAQLRIETILADAQKELDGFSSSLKAMWEGQKAPKSTLKTLEQLEQRLASIKELSKSGYVDSSALSAVEGDYKAFQKTLHNLSVEFELMREEQKKAMLSPDEQKALRERANALDRYNKLIEKNNQIRKKREPLETQITEKEQTIKSKSRSNTNYQNKINKLEASKPEITKEAKAYLDNLEKQKSLIQEIASLEEQIATKRKSGKFSEGEGRNNELTRQIAQKKELEDSLSKINLTSGEKEYKDYAATMAGINEEISKANKKIQENNEVINTNEKELKDLNRSLNQLKLEDEQVAFDNLKEDLKKFGVAGIEAATNIDELITRVNELKDQALAEVGVRIQNAEANLKNLSSATNQIKIETDKATESIKEHNKALNDQRAFISRISQFVGLEGAVQLARRALRDAFSTIKELDAAMTEMAVVTDLGVGDYWDQLPQYTKQANALGISIKGAYEAATLYYQQGLKTNEVTAMTNETLKMARIAGLSAEDATNKMTAALRGFNMELNETSAQRVADVYSELAAITASDVKEISSAMTKTASIASSAGMEFETTAAFLSQIIETTRESAETAGTAMKTVIARFQELKKDPAEIGEVDGEIVDANKIETALRSVGVALRDSNGQFRELDEVFLELSSKWDSLDTNTQRYIATIAAGSRQQSRFIAMMSDYSRTQELVAAANNSAGASSEQFAKTVESIGTKLTRLKNAWDTFTMGLMNDRFVKIGVDLLTQIITLLNKATEAFDGLGGTIGKMGLIFSVFKVGKTILDKFVIDIHEQFRQAGISAGKGFKEGFKEGCSGVMENSNKEKPEEPKKQKTGFTEKFRQSWSAFGESSMAFKSYQDLTQKPDEAKAKLTDDVYIVFKNKMTAMGKTNESIDKIWNKYVKDLKKGGKQGEAAINKLNKELEETADVNDYLDSLDSDGFYIPTSDELKSLGECSQAYLDNVEAIENGSMAEEQRQKSLKKSEEATKLLGEALGTVGQISIGVGVGLAALGGALEDMGLEGAAEGFSKVSAVLTTFGSVLMALPGIIQALGITFSSAGIKIAAAGITAQLGWWPLIAILAAIVAIIGVIAFASAQAAKNSPEKKIAAAEEATKKATEAAEEARSAYDELQKTLEDLGRTKTMLEDLKEGTDEWRKAMLEVNNTTLELLDLYPQLSEYVKFTENGLVELTGQGQQKLLEWQEEALQISEAVPTLNKLIETETKRKANIESNEFYRYLIEQVGYNFNSDKMSQEEEQLLNKIFSGELDLSSKMIRRENLAELEREELIKIHDLYVPDSKYINVDEYDKEKIIESIEINSDSEEFLLASQDILEIVQDRVSTNKSVLAYWLSEYNEDYQQLVQQNDKSQDSISKLSSQVYFSSIDPDIIRAGYKDGILSGLQNNQVIDIPELYNSLLEKNKKELNETAKSGNTTKELKTRMSEAHLLYDGTDDVKDLSTYYKYLTGVEYKSDKKKSDQDDELVQLITAAEIIKQIQGYTDQAYEAALSDETGALQKVLKLDLDVDTEEARAALEKLDISDEAKSIIDNTIKEIDTTVQDNNDKLAKIFGEDFVFNVKNKNAFTSKFVQSFETFSIYAGEAVTQLYTDTIKELNEASSEEELNIFMNKIHSVNWDSAIEGAAALKEMLQNTNVELRDFAENLLETDKSAYSATKQFNELYRLIGTDTLKELQQDGKITATEILELSKSNEKLSTVLKTTGTSAAALGRYYELLQKEMINTFEATQNFVDAMNELNAAQDAIEDSFGFIDTFSPSRSQTEIGSFFSDMKNSAMELYKMGAYGDQQLQDYVEAFLGDNWSKIIKKNSGDMKKALDEAMTQINSYGDNLYGAWLQLIESNLKGVSVGENGELIFDLDIVGDTTQLKKSIMKLGWGEEMANALVADAQTFSANLKKGLEKEDLEQALTTWLNEIWKFGDKQFIPKSQVELMAKALNVEVETLISQLTDQNYTVSDIITEDGSLMQEVREGLLQEFEETFDLDDTYAFLLEVGLDDAQAKAELKTLASIFQGTKFNINDQDYEEAAGKLKKVGSDSLEEGSISGLIDGLENPKVKAAQKQAAIEQGTMMAQSVAQGQIIGQMVADAVINKKEGGPDWESIKNTLKEVTPEIEGAFSELNAEDLAELKAIQSFNGKANGDTSVLVKSLMSQFNYSEDQAVSYAERNAQISGTYGDWENPYDELFNLDKELSATIRERERAERAYERALKDTSVTAKEVAEITEKQLSDLQKEAIIQKDRSQYALGKIQGLMNENQQYSDLYSFDPNTGLINVDWAKVEGRFKSPEDGEKFQEFISDMENYSEIAMDAQDELENIQDSVEEIEDRGRDATSEIYDKVKEGLMKQYEEQIDELESINESIEEASQKMIDKIQEQIDDARQARNNEKSLKNISDKETRLAYLKSDTSGGNALEIASLEKEIAEERENHMDTLIDQQIEKLQDANDKAAEQREQQMELQRMQLEAYGESEQIWTDVKSIVDDGLENVKNGLGFGDSKAGYLYNLAEDLNKVNPKKRDEIKEALEGNAKLAAIHEGFITLTGSDGKGKMTIQEMCNSIVNAINGLKEESKEPEMPDYGIQKTDARATSFLSERLTSSQGGMVKISRFDDDGNEQDYIRTVASTADTALTKYAKKMGVGLNDIFYYDGSLPNVASSAGYYLYFKDKNKEYTSKLDLLSDEELWLQKFATGGLADFTGPAWLDGTKSRPEIVLNQTDSQNFMILRDILADILDGASSVSKTSVEGSKDNYFDIEINVDQITDDYDVEQLANKIRDMIYADATYRNVNAINNNR